MDRTTGDKLAGIGGVLLLAVGLLTTWDAFQRYQEFDEMQRIGHGAMNAPPHPLWYLLGTLLVVGVLAGVYVGIRGLLFETNPESTDDGTTGVSQPETAERPTDRNTTDEVTEDRLADQRELLDVLPEDERRVLAPVFESPGLTQTELRDRSDFSKSKVSETVSDLEDRGLLYRESHGRTYRIYPDDDTDDDPP